MPTQLNCSSHARSFALATWLQSNSTSPLTGAMLPNKILLQNIVLRQLVDEWRARAGKRLDPSNPEHSRGSDACLMVRPKKEGVLLVRLTVSS